MTRYGHISWANANEDSNSLPHLQQWCIVWQGLPSKAMGLKGTIAGQ